MKKRLGCDNPFAIYGVNGDAKKFAQRSHKKKKKKGNLEANNSKVPNNSHEVITATAHYSPLNEENLDAASDMETPPKKTTEEYLQVIESRAGLRDGTLLIFITGPKPNDVDTAECIIEKIIHGLYHSLGASRSVYRVQLKSHIPEICKHQKELPVGIKAGIMDTIASGWEFAQWVTSNIKADVFGETCPSSTCRQMSSRFNSTHMGPEEALIVESATSLVSVAEKLMLI